MKREQVGNKFHYCGRELFAEKYFQKSKGGSIGSKPTIGPRDLSSNPYWGKLSWIVFLSVRHVVAYIVYYYLEET